MPPKVSITKDQILKAAFELVRKHGWDQLSARNLGREIGCSTQPIYTVFLNMNELEKELIKIIQDFVLDKYLLGGGGEDKFFKIGLGYVKFAREEREFYHLLYLSGKIPLCFENDIYPVSKELLLKRMQEDPLLSTLELFQLKRLLKNLWIYTHGITTIIYTFPDAMSDEYIFQSIYSMGGIAISWEFMEGHKHPEEIIEVKGGLL